MTQPGTGLAAALTELPAYGPAARGPKCSIHTVLTRLGRDQPDAVGPLTAAVDDEAVTARALADTLSTFGYPVKEQTVRRHRRRGTSAGCVCPR